MQSPRPVQNTQQNGIQPEVAHGSCEQSAADAPLSTPAAAAQGGTPAAAAGTAAAALALPLLPYAARTLPG